MHVLLLLLIFATFEDETKNLEVVPSVDLSRYAGVWYEIARLPNRFQENCAGDVTATYFLREDGRIDVVNECRTKDDERIRAEGVARLASEDGPSSKLKVRFAPAFLSFLPFVWGDYWILELAPDYGYALVGEPEREYLWILSRTPNMEDETYRKLLARAKELGFDVGRVQKTDQWGALE